MYAEFMHIPPITHDKQTSTWRVLPNVPHSCSSACVVDGVLLAIGGAEDRYYSKKLSAIYAFHHVDRKWMHAGDMPFPCSYVDVLSENGKLLLIDGYSQRVLKISVQGQ